MPSHDQDGDSHVVWDFAYPGGMTAHQRGVHPKTVPPCHQGLQLLLHIGSEKGPSSGLSVLRTNCYSSSGGMGPCAVGFLEGAMLSKDVRFLHDFWGAHSFWTKTVTSTKTLMYKLSGNVWWKGSSIQKPNRKRMTNRKRLQDGQAPRLQSAIPFLP